MVPRARLMGRLHETGVLEEIQWSIYEAVTSRVQVPGAMADLVTSTIRVKEACPLSTCFYTLMKYLIDRIRGPRASLMGGLDSHIAICTWYYAYCRFPWWFKTALACFAIILCRWDLIMNVGKTRVMVFNTTQAWATRYEHQYNLGGEPIERVKSYLYLQVSISGT